MPEDPHADGTDQDGRGSVRRDEQRVTHLERPAACGERPKLRQEASAPGVIVPPVLHRNTHRLALDRARSYHLVFHGTGKPRKPLLHGVRHGCL